MCLLRHGFPRPHDQTFADFQPCPRAFGWASLKQLWPPSLPVFQRDQIEYAEFFPGDPLPIGRTAAGTEMTKGRIGESILPKIVSFVTRIPFTEMSDGGPSENNPS